MKTLTNIYVKVTKGNYEELKTMFTGNFIIGNYLHFLSDDIENGFFGYEPLNKQKVSLNELKRLIDIIPTREEIKRLKQQISGYKTNLLLTNEHCKELKSYNERLIKRSDSLTNKIKELRSELKEHNEYIHELKTEIQKLKNRKWWQLIKF